jgi:hypothetical protein
VIVRLVLVAIRNQVVQLNALAVKRRHQLPIAIANRIQKPILRVLGDAVLLSPVVLLWG